MAVTMKNTVSVDVTPSSLTHTSQIQVVGSSEKMINFCQTTRSLSLPSVSFLTCLIYLQWQDFDTN